MAISSEKTLLSLLAAGIFMSFPNHALASTPDAGVSRALAEARANRIANTRYRLSFSLKEHGSTVDGSESVTFESNSAGDLAIDYRDGLLLTATLNGHTIPIELKNGHLILPVVAGANIFTATFVSNAAPAGKAMTRYEDKDDGSEYFYTLFVPIDASMAFPCFDQPDLKAKFRLDVQHPAGWSAISNTAASSADGAHTKFAETLPISTYLFAFAAGPFAAIHSSESGAPTVYVRKSQLARARQEAPQVQRMAARGIGYFAEYFDRAFPFPKYDLVLIPGFPFGGMEHAGATFLNEDSVLFRSSPTASDYFRRNTLVLHETCHQWFGDLVTMRWFDDLWLKEGFAQYMAYKALAVLEPASNPWKHFYEDVKPLAYDIDETGGTTPIFQNVENLKDAKSAYGAIVYQKAPAVLKQLDYRMGNSVFRDGLRTYVKRHAYGNAQWSDLIAAFKSASLEDASHANGKPGAGTLDAWADAWIKHRGMPQVDAAWSCTDGKIDRLVLTQHDVLPEGLIWPISSQILLHYEIESGAASHMLRADWNTTSVSVVEAIGLACPDYLFANAGDEAYGRFLLDAASEKAAARQLVERAGNELDPLLRSMLWGALWENVHVAKSPPRRYIELALKAMPSEDDESLARIQGARVGAALHSYVNDRARMQFAPRAEAALEDRMLHASSLDLRIVAFRSLTSIAETSQALGQVKELLSGKLTVPGLELKPLDRWNLVGRLIAMNDPEAQAFMAAEKAHDHSSEGEKSAYAAEAGTASAEVKARYFEEYVHSESIQEDWLTQSLRPFNSWNQATLTAPYLTRALDALAEIKQHRKIFFLGAWLDAFIGGQNNLQASQGAQVAVKAWLAGEKIDADLRLKVLQAADALDRTVAIKQKFPE